MSDTRRDFFRKPCRRPAPSQEEADRQIARACCTKCERPKRLHDEVITLANGLRLAPYSTNCDEPDADCAAAMSANVIIEPSEVGEQIVRRILDAPELKPLDVGMLICCVPGEYLAFLSYDYPDQAAVFRVAAEMPDVWQRQAEPSAAPDPAMWFVSRCSRSYVGATGVAAGPVSLVGYEAVCGSSRLMLFF